MASRKKAKRGAGRARARGVDGARRGTARGERTARRARAADFTPLIGPALVLLGVAGLGLIVFGQIRHVDVLPFLGACVFAAMAIAFRSNRLLAAVCVANGAIALLPVFVQGQDDVSRIWPVVLNGLGALVLAILVIAHLVRNGRLRKGRPSP